MTTFKINIQFFILLRKWKSLSCVWLFVTPWTVPNSFLCPWDSSDKSTGVGCHALLEGIFPTRGSNPGHLSFLCHHHPGQSSSPLLLRPGPQLLTSLTPTQHLVITYTTVVDTIKTSQISFLCCSKLCSGSHFTTVKSQHLLNGPQCNLSPCESPQPRLLALSSLPH